MTTIGAVRGGTPEVTPRVVTPTTSSRNRSPTAPSVSVDFIPEYPGTITPPKDLNRTATPAAERQMTVAALDALLPIPYGIVRMGALLCNVLSYGGDLLFWCLWGKGPIASFDSVTGDDVGLPRGSSVTHYKGLPGQAYDPVLRAAFAHRVGLPFTEACPGVAHSVIRIPAALVTGEIRFNAVIHAKLVYDPRLDSTNGGSGSHRLNNRSTWAFSRNPSLILADFLRSTEYGDGKEPVWSSVAACADLNDAMIGSPAQVSRLADFSVDREASTASWITTMRNAASVWLVPQGDRVKFVPDAPSGASVMSFSHAAGNVIAVTSETLEPANQLPTVMEVIRTDTSQLPWRDVPVTVMRPGVAEGLTPYRKATVRMQWVVRHAQAVREATERLKKLWLNGLGMRIDAFDEAGQLEIGDPIDLTFPDSGYGGLPLRMQNMLPTPDGWALMVRKNDPAVYSEVVEDGPSIVNTALPLPVVKEFFSGTSDATVPVLVTLAGAYSERVDLVVNVVGAANLNARAANVTLSEHDPNTFTVEVLDGSGNRVAAPFTGTFYGRGF